MTDTPPPPTGDTSWMDKAACVDYGRDLWFPGPQHYKSLERVRAEAKAICGRCHVQDDCLTYAMINDIRDGMWGGLTEKERSKIRGCYPKPQLLSTRSVPCDPQAQARSLDQNRESGQCDNTPGPEQAEKEPTHE